MTYRVTPIFAVCCLSLFAASCAPYIDPEAARREQERQDYNTCVGYGTVPNTPAFNDCMRDLSVRNGYDYRADYRDYRYERDYRYDNDYNYQPSPYPRPYRR